MEKDYIQYSNDEMARSTFEVALLAECIKHQCDVRGVYTPPCDPVNDIILWVCIDSILNCINEEKK